jgi:hypothetical protein
MSNRDRGKQRVSLGHDTHGSRIPHSVNPRLCEKRIDAVIVERIMPAVRSLSFQEMNMKRRPEGMRTRHSHSHSPDEMISSNLISA